MQFFGYWLINLWGETPLKNLLLDKLGGKMGAVYDYGQRKELKGFKQGFKQGFQESFREGFQGVVLKLYENGMGIDEISKNTGIDVEEIEKMLDH